MAKDPQLKSRETVDTDRQQGILNNEEAVARYNELLSKELILFEAITGSQAYGTALPTSDVDKKFVYIEPLERILNGTATKQLNVNKDYVGYEVGRYIELLQTNNPNILELLASPADCIIQGTPMFERYFINNLPRFISKDIKKSFGQYAATQIHKARGLNKKIVKPMEGPRKGLSDFLWVSHKQGSRPLKDYLKDREMSLNDCGVSAIDHMKNCYHLFYDPTSGFRGITDVDDVQIKTSSIPKDYLPEVLFYANIEGFQSYCKEYKEWQDWTKNRNEERYQTNQSHGAQYDSKNMMHCHRLLDTALEILQTGQIHVRRPNREELLDIRAGKTSYEDLVANAEEKVRLMEEAAEKSNLPEKVDRNFCRELLLKIRKDVYFHAGTIV